MKIDAIIRSRRKTIGIYVYPDGRVEVRAPRRATRGQIQAFCRDKEVWIQRKQEQAEQFRLSARPKQFIEGEAFLFLGKSYPLSIVNGTRPGLPAGKPDGARLSLAGGRFLLESTAVPQARAIFEAWYRGQARHVITDRVVWYAAQHGFEYSKICITGATSRWGSCSSRGTLSFTWRLVMGPPSAIDYVVVHELAHLRVKNHSAEYWEAVAAIMPDYAQRRDWLRHNAHTLTLDGIASG